MILDNSSIYILNTFIILSEKTSSVFPLAAKELILAYDRQITDLKKQLYEDKSPIKGMKETSFLNRYFLKIKKTLTPKIQLEHYVGIQLYIAFVRISDCIL